MNRQIIEYIVHIKAAFGESFSKKFKTKKRALAYAEKYKENGGYASEVFEVVLAPVEERIAKFGNTF
jgi:hypothetical protein